MTAYSRIEIIRDNLEQIVTLRYIDCDEKAKRATQRLIAVGFKEYSSREYRLGNISQFTVIYQRTLARRFLMR